MDKPVLYFSLLGRKASGKSCLFTALNAPRKLNPNHLTCSFVEESNQFKRVVKTLKKEKFLEKQDNLQRDKLSNNLKENVETIQKGERLPSTDLAERYVYIFSINAEDKFGTDLALLDYAGELLNNKGETNEYFNALLKNMDSIFAIIGIPKGEQEEKDFNDEISKLTTAFKSIDIKRKDKSILLNIPIVLLVSKFDRFITQNNLDFNKYDECEKSFYSSDIYKNLEPLVQSIKNITEDGMFKIFLTSAFGECTENDIPKNREQLDPINLLEPFEWAARKSAALKIKECENELNSNGIFRSLFRFNSFYDQAEALLPTFPENSEEYKTLTEIDTKFKTQKTKRNKAYCSIFILFISFVILSLLSLDCYFDYGFYQEMEVEATTVKSCQERIEALRTYKNADFYRHMFARFSFLPNENAEERIALLEKAIYVKEIEDIKNEKDIDARISKCDNLLAENPTRINADEIKTLKNNALDEKWEKTATVFKNDLMKKSASNIVASTKEIAELADRLTALEKECSNSHKQSFSELKLSFDAFIIDNARLRWEQSAVEVEKLINIYRNSSDDLSDDDDLSIRDCIASLENSFSDGFDNEGKIKGRLENIKLDYEKLIFDKSLKTWEKSVNGFEKELSDFKQTKKAISESIYTDLNKKLKSIKNSHLETFKKSDVITRLERDLKAVYLESKAREWNSNVNKLENEVKKVEASNDVLPKEQYEKLLAAVTEQERLYEDSFNNSEIIKNLKDRLETVYIEGQKKKLRERAAKLENQISSCSVMDDLEKAKTKINTLYSDIQELSIEVSKNKNWNLDNDMSELKKIYFAAKRDNSLKLFRKTYQDKINEASKYSTSDDSNDWAKPFSLFLELKDYIDGMENEIEEKVFVEYAKNYFDSFSSIFEKTSISLASFIKEQCKTHNYDGAIKTLNKVLKDEALVTLMKYFGQEKELENLYKNIIQGIDLDEFIYEYNKLCEISEQNYKEIFSNENKTKLNNFINKYSNSSRDDFQQFVKNVKKLYDYLNEGKATLLVEIYKWEYPDTFQLGDKSLTVEASPFDGSGWEFSNYDKGKSLIRFSVDSISFIKLKATCYGTYDNVGPFNDRLTYSGTGTFDDNGNCEISMTLTAVNYNESFSYDKTYNDAYGTLKAKIVMLADLPELTPLVKK